MVATEVAIAVNLFILKMKEKVRQRRRMLSKIKPHQQVTDICLLFSVSVKYMLFIFNETMIHNCYLSLGDLFPLNYLCDILQAAEFPVDKPIYFVSSVDDLREFSDCSSFL